MYIPAVALIGRLRLGALTDLELARRAADLGFDEKGHARESMPFHHEMSDSSSWAVPSWPRPAA